MKNRLSFSLTLFLLLIVSLLAGCSPSKSNDVSKSTQVNSVQTQTQETNIETSQFPITFKDADGKEFTIEKKPERIISLIPSNTEITYALGMGDAIVGVTDYDNYPLGVEQKEKIGGLELNVEKILSLEPDLILAHASVKTSAEAALKQLSDAGMDVVLVNDAKSLSDVYTSIDMISKATGTEAEGEALISKMKESIAKIADKASQIQDQDQALVWVEVDPTLFTTGKGTFMDEMLSILHAKNAAGNLVGWVQFSEEDAVKLNPDVIITTYGDYVPNAVEQVLNRKAWAEVNAVKNKRVYNVNPDIVTRSGPRLVEGIKELAQTIYPDIIWE